MSRPQVSQLPPPAGSMTSSQNDLSVALLPASTQPLIPRDFSFHARLKLMALLVAAAYSMFYVVVTKNDPVFKRITGITPNTLTGFVAAELSILSMRADFQSHKKMQAVLKSFVAALLAAPFFFMTWTQMSDEKKEWQMTAALASFFGNWVLNWLGTTQFTNDILPWMKNTLSTFRNCIKNCDTITIREEQDYIAWKNVMRNLELLEHALRFAKLSPKTHETINAALSAELPTVDAQYAAALTVFQQIDLPGYPNYPLLFEIFKKIAQVSVTAVSLYGAGIFTCDADSSAQKTFPLSRALSLSLAPPDMYPSFVLSFFAGWKMTGAAFDFIVHAAQYRKVDNFMQLGKYGAAVSLIALTLGALSSVDSGAPMVFLLSACSQSLLQSPLLFNGKFSRNSVNVLANISMVIFNLYYATRAVLNFMWDCYRAKTNNTEMQNYFYLLNIVHSMQQKIASLSPSDCHQFLQERMPEGGASTDTRERMTNVTHAVNVEEAPTASSTASNMWRFLTYVPRTFYDLVSRQPKRNSDREPRVI